MHVSYESKSNSMKAVIDETTYFMVKVNDAYELMVDMIMYTY